MTRKSLQRSSVDPALVALSMALGFSVAGRLDGPRLLRRSPRQWWGSERRCFTPRSTAVAQRIR